jgi:hypothetical protein
MKLPYQYKWFNGAILCDAWTDQYNSFNETEFELDNRHKFLIHCFHLMGYMKA